MIRHIRKFFELEAATGILLIAATALSLLIANSGSFSTYDAFLNLPLPLNFESVNFYKELTLRDWINDALMAIFFLFVGMELKEELLVGELSSKSRALLPAIAAAGGVILPALIFYFFNRTSPENLRGFAIPTATDIAFAYGVICFFGKKIPKSLQVFLVSLAIFDDLIAILIIAFFYTQNLQPFYLLVALAVMFALWILNLKKVGNLAIYLSLGVVLWLAVLKSGVHATLAGVALAMFIPIQSRNKKPLEWLIHKISPSVNFLILPLFAFANAGVRFESVSSESLTGGLVIGITFGLFFGKQIGVFLASLLAIKLKICHMPRCKNHGEVGWMQFYGVMILTGIGFTMSLFIGSLAFANDRFLFDEVKIGVLAGSLLSTVVGVLVIAISLCLSPKHANRAQTHHSKAD
jgi:NhaA family Na+:H+ antiporter